MPRPFPRLAAMLDDLYPPTGTLGYVLLLDGELAIATISSINTATEVVTTGVHNLTTGARVRLSTTGILPTSSPPVSAGVDYFANAIDADELTFHMTLADAVAGTNPINFSDSGTGTHTITEQQLTFTDRKEVLIAHELDHPDYTRQPITDIGAASTTTGLKPQYTWTQTVAGGEPTLEFKHYLVLDGGSATIGDTTGNVDTVITKTTPVTITAGNSKLLGITLGLENEA